MRNTALVLIVVGIAGLSVHAFGRGPGGMGGGGAHGPAYQSMPSQATTNSNAPWTGNQEKGLDRAQDRMSDQGLANEKATQNQNHRGNKPREGGRAPR